MNKTEPKGVEAVVCEDIGSRQRLGMAKYGVSVANNPLDLRQWLNHAYEECLDQAIYLKRAMVEIDHKLETQEEMEDQRNVARVVAADAVREIERILETGDTYCTREIVANLKEALTPGSFLHNA